MSGHGLDLLAVGPHPDDVELFCGGTVIRCSDLGYRVGVLDLSRGERASHGTPEERAREAQNAAGVMGLALRENLGLPDAGIDPYAPDQVLRAVEALRRLRPEIVLVPWREDRHPDHVAAAELMLRALFFANVGGYARESGLERFAPRQVLHYPMRVRIAPSFVVDTSAVADRKAAAIVCHASQVTRRAGEAPTLIGSSGALDAIEARDRYYGSMIGVSHGEALRTVAVPGLHDPVRHFRENDFPGAHAFEPSR